VFNLIRNENVKIYRRMRSYIFMAIILAATIIVGVVVHNTQAQPSADWKQQLMASNQQVKQQSQDSHIPKVALDKMNDQVKVNQYEIDHNINPYQETSWDFSSTCAGIVSLITIFVAVVAGDIVASEFSAGTIKLLLIRPVNRTKILFSKYFATLLFAVTMVLGLLVVSLVIGGILFGFSGSSPFIYTSANGVVHEGTMLVHVLSTYALDCIELVMIVTISFMISTIFRSSSLAIALSILMMFLGNTAVTLLSKYSWDKYILFANTDLTQYTSGQPTVAGMTLTFSIVVLVVYFVIFHVASWLLFTKRDVGA
jgi:ABC-2 type transport system permease protein